MYGSPNAYGPPVYGVQQPYNAPQAGATLINLGGNDNNGTPCMNCGRETAQVPRKKIGCVTISWCLCLFVFTFGTAWCYPFCVDSCKDTEIICVKCQQVKQTIPANCC